MASGRRLVLLVTAVLVLAADLGVVAARRDRDEPPPPPTAADLLAAYERSRSVTFVVLRTFTRTLPDGRSISYEQRLVQRPPGDRLLVGAGAASGRLDGQVLRCGTDPTGASRCFEGTDAGPWDEDVAREVENLRGLIEGPGRIYDVEAAPGAGCFGLRLVRGILAPPYGERAVFCFDPASGAPTRVEVHRPEAVDVTVTTEIRTEVTDADLRPGDLGDLVTGVEAEG